MSGTHWHTRFAVIGCIFLLSACSLTDKYNAQAYQQLKALQTSWQHFLEDAAVAPLDAERIAQDDSQLRQGFDDALIQAALLNDSLRIENLTLLEDAYIRLHARLLQQNHSLSPVQTHLYRQQAQMAWQLAIEGECLRPGAACDGEK